MGNTELMNVNGLGQVRVTQMNGSSRKRCSSCVDDEVCANPVRSKRKNLKKLLTRSASLEIRRLAFTRHLPRAKFLGLETVYFRRVKPLKSRIMYIECKGNEISGPAHWSCDVFQVWQVLVLPRTPIPYAFRRWVQSKLS